MATNVWWVLTKRVCAWRVVPCDGSASQLLVQYEPTVKYLPYSQKIWWGINFGGPPCNSQFKICQNILLAYIHMVIPYRTAKFKSANILAMVILGPTAKLIPANISSYMVAHTRCLC